MRMLTVLLALSMTVPALYGCTLASPKSKVYQTMNNTPNQCGTGFKRDRDAC